MKKMQKVLIMSIFSFIAMMSRVLNARFYDTASKLGFFVTSDSGDDHSAY